MTHLLLFESYPFEESDIVFEDATITAILEVYAKTLSLYMIDKKTGEQTGYIAFWGYITLEGANYFLLDRIEITEHRGKGYGHLLYKLAMKHLPVHVDGIASDLSKRINKEQIPSIWKRYDHRIITFGMSSYDVINKHEQLDRFESFSPR